MMTKLLLLFCGKNVNVDKFSDWCILLRRKAKVLYLFESPYVACIYCNMLESGSLFFNYL